MCMDWLPEFIALLKYSEWWSSLFSVSEGKFSQKLLFTRTGFFNTLSLLEQPKQKHLEAVRAPLKHHPYLWRTHLGHELLPLWVDLLLKERSWGNPANQWPAPSWMSAISLLWILLRSVYSLTNVGEESALELTRVGNSSIISIRRWIWKYFTFLSLLPEQRISHPYD